MDAGAFVLGHRSLGRLARTDAPCMPAPAPSLRRITPVTTVDPHHRHHTTIKCLEMLHCVQATIHKPCELDGLNTRGADWPGAVNCGAVNIARQRLWPIGRLNK